jgi:hypothetical protein
MARRSFPTGPVRAGHSSAHLVIVRKYFIIPLGQGGLNKKEERWPNERIVAG